MILLPRKNRKSYGSNFKNPLPSPTYPYLKYG